MPTESVPGQLRTYRPKFGGQSAVALVAMLFAIGAWAFGSGKLIGNSFSHVGTGVGFGLGATACTIGVGFCIAQIFRTKLTIDGDRLVYCSASGQIVVDRAELAGWYIYQPPKSSPQLVLRSMIQGKGPWRIPRVFATDLAFDEWLGVVPQVQRPAIEDWGAPCIQNEPGTPEHGSGTTEHQQLRQWHSEVSLWAIMHMIAVAIALQTAFTRHPSDLLLNLDATLPFVAATLVMLCGRPWTFSVGNHASTLPLIAIPVIASIGLFAHVPTGSYELDPSVETEGAVAGGLAILVLFLTIDRTLRRSIMGLSFALPITVAYAGVLFLWANSHYNQTLPNEYSAQVLYRSQYTGRHGSVSYSLTLAPWGPVEKPFSVAVNPDVFSAAGKNILCIDLQSGKERMRWIALHACQDPKSTTANGRRP